MIQKRWIFVGHQSTKCISFLRLFSIHEFMKFIEFVRFAHRYLGMRVGRLIVPVTLAAQLTVPQQLHQVILKQQVLRKKNK